LEEDVIVDFYRPLDGGVQGPGIEFGDGRTAAAIPLSVTIPAGETTCFTIHANNMGNSSNGEMRLWYNFTYENEFGVEVNVNDVTPYTGTNDLPPCGTCV